VKTEPAPDGVLGVKPVSFDLRRLLRKASNARRLTMTTEPATPSHRVRSDDETGFDETWYDGSIAAGTGTVFASAEA
jgi:hypothetical protein